MKTKLILLVAISFILINNAFTQEKPENVKIVNGNIEPIVQSIQGITADSGYYKLNEWINYNYKNAGAVIGSSIESKFIRFTGIKASYATSMGYVYDLEYTIKVEFKNEKYRLTIEELKSGNKGIFANINLADYYKSNGEPRKAYQNFTTGIESSINEINLSIYNYLTNKMNNESDDW
jgi:hypothetical protein